MSLRHPVAAAMAAFMALAVLGLWLRPLFPIDETRYLAVAWEMHLSGNWLVPTKNFALYSDKPPLLFWMINLIWMLTGVSEFAARLVGPLAGCVAIWLTAVLARRLWPEDAQIAGRAALGLVGLVVFALSASLTMFDVPLTVATLLGLIALARAGAEGATRAPWVGFGAALALGVVTKGPVILFHLLPAAILLPLWSVAPLPWSTLLKRLVFGVAVALAFVAMWLLPASILGGPEYRAAILWHQSAGRLTGSFAHARPWWFYLALLPVLAFPLFWSLGLWRNLPGLRLDRGVRLCLIWIGAAFLLFSLTSGKQLHYLVPELPAFALIAARLSGPRAYRLRPAAAVLMVLAACAIALTLGLIPLHQGATLVTPKSMFVACALLLVATGWLAARQSGAVAAAILSLGTLLAGNVLIGTTDMARIYSAHPMATALAPHAQDGLAYVGEPYHAQFNFAARLTAPVQPLTDVAAVRDWSRAHPQGLILGLVDKAGLPLPPRDTILFRNSDYGIWPAADINAATPEGAAQ